MQSKYTFPLVVAASMLGVTAGSSAAIADDEVKVDTEKQSYESRPIMADDKVAVKTERHGDEHRSAMADDKATAKTEKHGDEKSSAINDAWLHGKLESALLFNEHLDSFAINTSVKNGTASLQGAVESDIDRDLAGEIAKSIKGVTSVKNELVVDKAKAAMMHPDEAAQERQGFKQSVGNATLTARVKTKLLLNGNTGGMAINVDSAQGVVTLSGDVKSDEEKDLAVKLTSNTSGAMSVTDNLIVKPQ